MAEQTEQRQGYSSLAEFYPFYLSEHRNRTCRRLHFIGTTLVLLTTAYALATLQLQWLLAVPLFGYAFAWLGHFLFEKNRPATFKHPWYSLASDFIMYRDLLTGRIRF